MVKSNVLLILGKAILWNPLLWMAWVKLLLHSPTAVSLQSSFRAVYPQFLFGLPAFCHRLPLEWVVLGNWVCFLKAHQKSCMQSPVASHKRSVWSWVACSALPPFIKCLVFFQWTQGIFWLTEMVRRGRSHYYLHLSQLENTGRGHQLLHYSFTTHHMKVVIGPK